MARNNGQLVAVWTSISLASVFRNFGFFKKSELNKPESVATSDRNMQSLKNYWDIASKTIVQKGVFSISDQVIISAANFLTGVIIGRFCIEEQFGLYMLGFSIVTIVIDLQTSLIATPYMILSPHLKGKEHAKYNGSSLVHQITFSLIVIIFLFLGGFIANNLFDFHGLKQIIRVLVFTIMFITLKDYIRRICFATMQIKSVLFFDLSASVIQISGLFLIAYLGFLSASNAFWIVGISSGIATFIWIYFKRKTFSISMNQAISDLKRNLVLGKWFFASGFIWALSMYTYPWILAGFHGASATGVWAACWFAVNLGNPILFGIHNFLGPKIVQLYAEKGVQSLRQFTFKASAYSSAVFITFVVIMLIVGGKLVTLIYGDKYAGNSLVVSVLSLNLLVTAGAFSFSRGLFAIRRADLDFKVNIVGLFVLFTIGLWLVYSFGVLGAALGLLIANILSSITRYIVFKRITSSSSRN